jgi:hypothetical protein
MLVGFHPLHFFFCLGWRGEGAMVFKTGTRHSCPSAWPACNVCLGTLMMSLR